MADEVTAEVMDDDEDPRPAGALSRPDAVGLAENGLRDRLYERVIPSVHGIVRFHEVSMHTAEPPQAWIDEFGEEEAKRMLMLARLCYQPKRNVPYGVTAIMDTYRGLEQARAAAKVTRSPVAVQVNIGMPATELPVLDVKKEDDGG